MSAPTRRRFVMSLPVLGAAAIVSCRKRKDGPRRQGVGRETAGIPETAATVYRAVNGSPGDNLEKVLALMGGAEALFGDEDVVILKPNLQWYNQGAPNIAAMDRLVTLIMERRGGFRGEVVLAENIHRGAKPWERAGWAVPFVRNADLPGVRNYNELAGGLKKRYGDRFSVCHLVNIASGGKRVRSSADGPGYVICDGTGGVPLLSFDNGLAGGKRREVVMSYPILRTDRGTLIDYRLGVWENGIYTERAVKFVNCAALNHHSVYCGFTSAVKNYLGVSDLSGGPDPAGGGRLAGTYFNFHSFPFDGDAKGPVPGMLGAEVGHFLKTVRRPTLNITTAEYCGLVDRVGLPVARTRAVAASADPVALDFHTAKYILFANSGISLHDPENRRSPSARYLRECARTGDYCYDESRVEVASFDLAAGRLQGEGELVVRADRQWGGNLRSLLKYAVLKVF
jgi:hypothetical protein